MTRRQLVSVGVVVGLVALASVAFVRGRTLEVVDAEDRSIESAYVMYHREGARFGLAHPLTYEATPHALVRTDRAGRARIPAVVLVHWPWPFESHPRLIVDFLYAPTLHNGLANLRAGDGSRPGVFEVHADRVRLADVSYDPALWYGTLLDGSFFLPNVIGRPQSRRSASGTLAAELLGDLVEDYAAFLHRYRDAARPRPEMPAFARYGTDDDRRGWREMVDRDLAQEPTWGQAAERVVGRSLRAHRQH